MSDASSLVAASNVERVPEASLIAMAGNEGGEVDFNDTGHNDCSRRNQGCGPAFKRKMRPDMNKCRVTRMVGMRRIREKTGYIWWGGCKLTHDSETGKIFSQFIIVLKHRID